MTIGDIRFRSNRKSGVFLEYPICKDINENYDNSWEHNWDEILYENEDKYWREYVPTYDECINKFNSYSIAIIDMICSHKRQPYYAIEICNKIQFHKKKINK